MVIEHQPRGSDALVQIIFSRMDLESCGIGEFTSSHTSEQKSSSARLLVDSIPSRSVNESLRPIAKTFIQIDPVSFCCMNELPLYATQ